ncbi:hypothetical protein [Rhizobium sp. HT1-10]|uniref:hypothetical protein n=1 Tax=Rhizobium sp. HT1-10 TaxID=3111638 RepID=UPI003C13A18A
MKTVAILLMLSLVTGCATTQRQEFTADLQKLRGDPQQTAVKVFGEPNKTVRNGGGASLYWLKVRVEDYAGPSNIRTITEQDGKRIVSETYGMKMKQHRYDCIVKIDVDTASVIQNAEVIGDVRGCEPETPGK